MAMRFSSTLCLVFIVLDVVLVKVASHNYSDALAKSILFYEGQRSGKLPSSQRMKWRKDSALHDGDVGVDLTGGYYDAGDNVKFNFPMAFSMTVLAWGVIEYGDSMGSEIVHAHEAVRWGADYLLKSTSVRDRVYVQVADANKDHICWQRPEDMDTDRTAFFVTKDNPGSEVAAEIAAALAASSLVFKSYDLSYSKQLLQRAIEVFEFADKYRGKYSDHLGQYVCPFYCDYSGYEDELVWAASWLYKATNNNHYWRYILHNVEAMERMKLLTPMSTWSSEFSWEDKHAGVYVLVANNLLMKQQKRNSIFLTKANEFACSILPETKNKYITYSPGGLLVKEGVSSNLQRTTALTFLVLAHSRYLIRANKPLQCGNIIIKPERLIEVAKGQVDYILGNNPMKMSYMVGYGKRFPEMVHHRGSTLPSIDKYPKHLRCHDGDRYFNSMKPNINELTGAVLGGPYPNDTYIDSRSIVALSEPTTYINAPFVGVLAYFSSPKKL